MLLIGINHYLSLGRGKGGIPWLKGEPREGGGGSGVTNKVQREDCRISDKSRCAICERKTIIWLVVFKSICSVSKLKNK